MTKILEPRVIHDWGEGEIVADGDGVGYFIRVPDGYSDEGFFFGADEIPTIITGLVKALEQHYTGESK